MRIGFVTTDWSEVGDEDGFPTLGGSAYYRVGLPFKALKEHGHEVFLAAHLGMNPKTGELIIADWREEMTQDLEMIVLHRWMEGNAADAIRQGRAFGQVIVNDVDDHFDGLSPANHAWRTTHPMQNAKSNRAHYRKALEASSALTASTPFLRDWYRSAGLRVELIRNAVDLSEPWPRTFLGGSPVVGWTGMTSVRSGDLEVVRGSIGPFLESHGGRFHHSGHYKGLSQVQDLLKLRSSTIVTTSPAVTSQHIPELYGKFNIGIVPLNDIPFNHAKSCIKGMEYAASGVPFVASRSPEYDRLQTFHDIGLTAHKPKDWKRALEMLADEDERKKQAEHNRDKLEALSLANRWSDWADTYATLLADLR